MLNQQKSPKSILIAADHLLYIRTCMYDLLALPGLGKRLMYMYVRSSNLEKKTVSDVMQCYWIY